MANSFAVRTIAGNATIDLQELVDLGARISLGCEAQIVETDPARLFDFNRVPSLDDHISEPVLTGKRFTMTIEIEALEVSWPR